MTHLVSHAPGLHSDWTLSGHMYHRFGIITESDLVSSRELTNTLKPVRAGLNQSSLELCGKVRSCLTLACSVVVFLGGQGRSHLLVSLTAQFSWTIISFHEEGSPSMAGPELSATYHLVRKWFKWLYPLGVHSMAVSRAPNCGMLYPFYTISVVSQGWSLVGLPSLGICLGNNLAKMQSGITLSLAPVLTLHLRLPCSFDLISAGMVTVALALVSASMLIVVMLTWTSSHWGS